MKDKMAQHCQEAPAAGRTRGECPLGAAPPPRVSVEASPPPGGISPLAPLPSPPLDSGYFPLGLGEGPPTRYAGTAGLSVGATAKAISFSRTISFSYWGRFRRVRGLAYLVRCMHSEQELDC